jgi:hypothetical protein
MSFKPATSSRLDRHCSPGSGWYPGSPGEETNLFGLLTYAALVKFRDARAAAILTPVGLTHGSGYFRPATQAFINGN